MKGVGIKNVSCRAGGVVHEISKLGETTDRGGKKNYTGRKKKSRWNASLKGNALELWYKACAAKKRSNNTYKPKTRMPEEKRGSLIKTCWWGGSWCIPPRRHISRGPDRKQKKKKIKRDPDEFQSHGKGGGVDRKAQTMLNWGAYDHKEKKTGQYYLSSDNKTGQPLPEPRHKTDGTYT